MLPRYWRNEVVWVYANAWIFACQRDHSSLSGHCASYWPLVLSEVPSVALGNALDGIPQITWSPLPPAGCRPWLGWVSHFRTSEPHPSFSHQMTPPYRADLVEVHSLIMQHPFFLRTEGLRESLLSEPLCCCCVTLVVSNSVQPQRWQPTRLPVPGILQARTLEWVTISFSIAWKWKVKVKSLSCVRLYRPHGLQPTRLLCPWDFLRKSTGVGCHCLLHRASLPNCKTKDYSRPETVTLKVCLQGWPLAGICELWFRENSYILTNKNKSVSLNSLCKKHGSCWTPTFLPGVWNLGICGNRVPSWPVPKKNGGHFRIFWVSNALPGRQHFT